MAGKNTAVFGIYGHRDGVENAVEALRQEGFRNTDISVLFPENEGTKDFAHEKHTKAPEGTATGATSGAVIGGALGWLAGIGALAIPGVGPFIAAGPIMAALAGAGAGGVVGGIAGALVGMGIPEYEAKRYEGRIKEGGILLSVHCDNSDWVKRAKQVLERTGAEDVGSAGEAGADFQKTDRPMRREQAV
jgi:ActD protein